MHRPGGVRGLGGRKPGGERGGRGRRRQRMLPRLPPANHGQRHRRAARQDGRGGSQAGRF
jgi:hypothetical protein